MHSPFTDILHTNSQPSDAECDSIRELLRRPIQELAHVQGEISHLQSLIDRLASKRAELKQFIDAHLALVSPARRLPEDIVRCIFLATLPTHRNPVICADEAPLLLCQISRHWRTIALTTPRLWASIHIAVPTHQELPRLTEMVDAWLKRSGRLPLDIVVVSPAVPADSGPRTYSIESLLRVLFSFSQRWRSLEVLRVCENYSHFQSLGPEDVPLLQHISVLHETSRPWGNLVGMFNFLAAESLRTAQLPIPFAINAPILWAALTSLDVTRNGFGPRYDRALALLQRCPNLRTCKLRVYHSTHLGLGDHDDMPQSFSLPLLAHLSLGQTLGGFQGPYLLDYLTLPALRSFHCFELEDFRPDVPLRCLFPSPTLLKSLTVDLVKLSAERLLEALSAMVHLEELSILREPPNAQTGGGNPDFLLQLAHSATDGAMPCPRLQILELKNFEEVSDDTILDFLRARNAGHNEPVCLLSRFACRFSRGMQSDILPALQDLIAAGLEVDLTYTEPPPQIPYFAFEGTEEEEDMRYVVGI
ncbi:hypothetical protein C8R46DRAFT_996182 [Mycena filopes]|nr:hypothetical protein C8R46DRAFT_996182 [Mycena filopes]